MLEGNRTRCTACARMWNRITSLVAIVAPPVRLWSGARWCLLHRRVPLPYPCLACGLFLFCLALPLPQNRAALYCLSLAMPFSVQNLIRVPATTRVDGAGTCFSRIHL